MSDWEVGDRALCVRADPCDGCGTPFPCEVDRSYIVEAVVPGDGPHEDPVHLRFQGVRASRNHGDCLPCSYFRKIVPKPPEACEEEFKQKIKNLAKKPVDA